MINQIAPLLQKTVPLNTNGKILIQARHIQPHARDFAATDSKPENGLVSSPLTGLPYLVPILRWIE